MPPAWKATVTERYPRRRPCRLERLRAEFGPEFRRQRTHAREHPERLELELSEFEYPGLSGFFLIVHGIVALSVMWKPWMGPR